MGLDEYWKVETDYSKPAIGLAHGYNSDGNYMAHYLAYLLAKGYPVIEHVYHDTDISNVRVRSKETSQVLARRIEQRARDMAQFGGNPHVVMIGHSNGALVSVLTAAIQPLIIGISANNAALRDDYRLPDSVRFFVNRYVPTDEVLNIAAVAKNRAWRVMGREDDWGNFGAKKYVGVSSARVINVNCGDNPGNNKYDSNGRPAIRYEHTDYLEDTKEGERLRQVWIPDELRMIKRLVRKHDSYQGADK